MRLSEFIAANTESILTDWESFARSIWPDTATVDPGVLRDHAEDMLRAIAADMASTQSAAQQAEKSKGMGGGGSHSGVVDRASVAHAGERHGSGFELASVIAEYRALRASVIRLWRKSEPSPDINDLDDLTRFNEAIDQSLTEAVVEFERLVEAERHAGEADLRQSEERFRQMANAAPAMLWITDATHQCTFLSEGWLTYTGQTLEEGMDRGWIRAIHPEDRERSEKIYLAAAERCEPFELEYRLRTSTGDYRWAIDCGNPQLDADGNFEGYIGSVFDIHDRRLAEESLRESQGLLQTIIDTAPDPVFAKDREGRMLVANNATLQALGQPRETVLGLRDIDWLTDRPEDAQKIMANDQRIMERGVLEEVDEWVTHNGVARLYAGRKAPLRNAAGEVIGVVGVSRDVTDQRNAEEALRRSEERFRTLADNISQFAWMTDDKGWIFWYNRRWYDYTGTNLEQMQEWGWTHVHHPDHVDRVVASFKQSIDTGEPWEDTFPLRRTDGEYRWFLSRAIPIRDDQGRILRWFGTNTDITEMREVQWALRRSEERLKAILDILPVGVFIADPTGRLLSTNAAADSIWCGKAPRSQRPQEYGDYKAWWPDSGKLVGADEWAMARAIATGEVCGPEELQIECYDGSRKTILNYAIPIETEGDRTGAVAVNVDITDRKQAEEELRRRAEEIERLLDIAPAAIWVAFDPECRIITGNRLANAFYEANEGENVSASTHPEARQFFSPDGRELSADELPMQVAAARNEAVFESEVHVRTESGRRMTMLGSAVPLRDERGQVRGCIGAFLDITDRIELQRQRDGLLQSERSARTAMEHALRAKDDFLSVVNHELRSPLAVVLGWARMLRDGKLDEEEIPEALDGIWRGAEQLKHLIDDLLDVARAASGKLKLRCAPLDVVALAGDELADFQSQAQEAEVQLEEDLPEEQFMLMGDSNRIRQVIANLLSNAIKFTSAGGRVRLRVLPNEHHVTISVEDTGIGIAPDVLPRLFAKFQQADSSMARVYKGLGLGLSLVKQITEMHGGTVRVESEGEGKGATFFVELPRLETPAAVEEAEGARDTDLNGLRVLVVDDDSSALALTSRLLEESGAAVTRCMSGAEALVALEAQPFDMLVSDISMPEMDGYALLHQVRSLSDAKQAAIPALAVTAFGREEDHQRSLAAGFDAHLSKPLEPTTLCATVNALAHSQT